MSDHEERRLAEQAQLLKTLQDNLDTPSVRQGMLTFARWRRANYLAYVEAGFTPGQALHLCTLPPPQ